ncbi:MAG TPA: hypothetical protein VFY06_01500 [Verrucomicrobiae bacterium]|nr:hypothetical protein [Verrucomicrobiae bacterium]
MKARFRAYRREDRDGMYYWKDSVTGDRGSLETKDPEEAERLVGHKNEALKNPHMNQQIGMTYLSAADPKYASRTWGYVMDHILKGKKKATLERYQRARKDPAYELIGERLLAATLPEHLTEVLEAGRTATNAFLRRYQNHAFGMGWLPRLILPNKLFPPIVHKEARGITAEEHRRIVEREGNPERADFYDVIWFTGASQSDAAMLHNDDIDRKRRCFVLLRPSPSPARCFDTGTFRD